MENITYQINGENSIAIQYDGTTEILKISNQIISINIDGPHQNFPNSFYIKTGLNNNLINQTLNNIEFNFKSTKNLFTTKDTSITKFLELFESGTYYVEFSDYRYNEFRLPINNYDLIIGGFEDYRLPLLCTKEKSEIDTNLVEKYKKEIKNGSKPIILSYRKDYGKGAERGSAFLLDGHHKLLAYSALKIKPQIWEIVNIGTNAYDKTNQAICKYLNFEEIKESSLKYFYEAEYDITGILKKLN